MKYAHALAAVALWFNVAPVHAAPGCPSTGHRVCVVDRAGQVSTFPNSCVAHLRHARVLHGGECAITVGCILVFTPVCARDPQSRRPKTYNNWCDAEIAHARVLHSGFCRSDA
jgi:hypothetical protein